jgi:uncharacterized protein (TIGR00297 family)
LSPGRWGVAAGLACGVAVLAYRRQTLTLDGAAASALLGSVVFSAGGGRAAATLLTFFIGSSALSHLGEQRKRRLPLAQAKGAQRDAWQVLANGGIATLCIAAGKPRGFVGALAAAAADTWATELGLLARTAPRSIATFQTVPRGTSGGITAEGLAASLGGALTVGLAWTLGGGGRGAIWRAAVAGLIGSLIDSLLGATAQAVYRCPHCDTLTEESIHLRCGTPTGLEKGYAWMNNDTVNTLATLTGAAIALL